MKRELTDCKIYLVLLIYVIVLLFFVSPDSYLHDLFERTDTAWFFMCGKAWMNGMIPYVDFSDSKGPLLWLIYGLGYELSHYSYIGVYWISCIFYSITFFICYKISILFLLNSKKSLLVSCLMFIPYFHYWFHYEIRAEDFCQPFIICSLYCLLQTIITPSVKNFKSGGVLIGLCFACCLLIKWSIAIMLLSVVFSSFILSLKHLLYRSYVVCLLLGISIIILPFLSYFILMGNFDDFINEYFINTFRTIHMSPFDTFLQYVYEWKSLLTSGRVVYVLYLLALVLFYMNNKKITLFPLFCGIWFISICIRHDNWGYYITASSSFAIFLLIYLVKYLHIARIIYLLGICVSIQVLVRSIFLKPNLFFDEDSRKEFYRAEYVISQIMHPRIINEGHEKGFGICANSLPATKYWAMQIGESGEMKAERHKAISEKQADFVICKRIENIEYVPFCDFLKENGYVFYTTVKDRELWGRPGLHLPDDSFYISNKDILFKKNIFR